MCNPKEDHLGFDVEGAAVGREVDGEVVHLTQLVDLHYLARRHVLGPLLHSPRQLLSEAQSSNWGEGMVLDANLRQKWLVEVILTGGYHQLNMSFDCGNDDKVRKDKYMLMSNATHP